MTELNNNMKCRRIADFYVDRSIFITGATGFMGKVLVEKLLYSCSQVKNIFILMRPKRQKSIENRLEEMFKLPLFERLQKEKPQLLKKIIPVPGDVTFDNLGMSNELRKAIIEEVSVVFHCAATLKLESNLKDAAEMNVWGTYRVLELAKEMKKLDVFVHLSTAFCHVDHNILDEKGYDFEYNPKDIMSLVRFMNVDLLDKITFDLIKPHPNTYTFTKRLAERLVIEEFPNLPVCIARPSIVSPSYREPVPGWVDNLNGPTGIMVAAGKGVLRSMYCKKEYKAQIIPVDYAISALLACAKKTALEKPKEINVYNITQGKEREMCWGEVLDLAKKFTFEFPFSLILWFPDGNIRDSLWSHKIHAFFLHWLPAYFIDFLLLIFLQKPFMIRVQKKIEVGLEVLQYFTTHQWNFINKKFLDLRESMCPEDKKEFSLDFKNVNIEDYFKISIIGARQYVMKEDPNNLPKSRRKIKIYYAIDRIVRFLLILFLARIVISWCGSVSYMFETTSHYVPFVRNFVPFNDKTTNKPV